MRRLLGKRYTGTANEQKDTETAAERTLHQFDILQLLDLNMDVARTVKVRAPGRPAAGAAAAAEFGVAHKMLLLLE